MDEGRLFDAENSRLQIKKLKEKVKSLVTEVDLSREIKSDEFPKTSKLLFDRNVNDISSELDLSDEDGDEFLDIKEADFVNEEFWLMDRNCNSVAETSSDIFKALYTEVEEFREDISDLYNELQLLRKSSSSSPSSSSSSSSSESVRCNNRNALIDSRTFTRPKKYSNRPPLTCIISNSGDEMRQGIIQRSSISPMHGVLNKFEDLSKNNNNNNNGTVSGVSGRDNNWEEGSEEGLADIGNSRRKSNRKFLPASIIDRLEELKKSNRSYVSCKTPENSKRFNVMNGNVEESEIINVSGDAKKITASFDSNVKNALNTCNISDIFKNIPEYFSDDNESFLSLDDVSGFCDRLTLSTDPGSYSSIFKEMEQNEICLYHDASSAAEDNPHPLKRLTFGGKEIPLQNAFNNIPGRISDKNRLLLPIDDLNKTFEIPVDNSDCELKQGDKQSEGKTIKKAINMENNQDFIDVILKSDIMKKNYNYRNCDNKNIVNITGDKKIVNNVNETFTQNELNKKHSEKYTTKVFDSSFRKSCSPHDRHNGKKDSDHSEDDCMSTTSDNSYKSVDSNSELRNIEELKNIALQQNMKLSEVKFSTPKLDCSKLSSRNSEEWRNVSPIRRNILDGESQGSSDASSRGPSPRGVPVPTGHEDSKKSQVFKIRQPPKVPQRELKLKPVLVRPSQNFKKPGSSEKPSNESVITNKNECKTSASAPGIPVIKPSIVPLTAVSSVPNSKIVTRIPSGIPRPPSRLKQPQIRASEAYKK